MKSCVAVNITSKSAAHAIMAAEALKATAESRGCRLVYEINSSTAPLSAEAIQGADVVVVASSNGSDTTRFDHKPIYKSQMSAAIQHPEVVLQKALELAGIDFNTSLNTFEEAPVVESKESIAIQRKIVAITSCPTGIAHTFMAAEALKKSAAALGCEIFVETQGSVGAKNTLTDEQIRSAAVVIIAADTNVGRERFVGKSVYSTGTNQAIQNGKGVITSALAQAEDSATLGDGAEGGSRAAASLRSEVDRIKAERSSSRTGVYKSLMSGVSYMLPVVVAGGLSIALSFALGGVGAHAHASSLVASLDKIGSTAFGIFVAVLSAYIAYSIADRPGLAPGLIGGMLAQSLGAGFLGGIVSGFLAGYAVKFMADHLKLPDTLEGLKPVLILPFLGSVLTGLLMIYVIAPPVGVVLTTMTNFLRGMQGGNAALLGLLLGAMMAFDMGGPVNKAAYTFSVGLLASHVSAPMAAVMAAGMTPPLGIAIATTLFKNRFDEEEREAGKAAYALGLAFITEGAIPFASSDPVRVIPSLVIGGAVAGAISMVSGVQLFVPHGGIFAMLIPGAVTHLLQYVIAILAGAFVTAGAMFVLKKPIVSGDAAKNAAL